MMMMVAGHNLYESFSQIFSEHLFIMNSNDHLPRILDSCTLPACDDCSTFARNQWEGINHSLEDKRPDMWFIPICNILWPSKITTRITSSSRVLLYLTWPRWFFRVLHDSYRAQCSQLYAENLPEAHMGPMVSIFSAMSLSCLLSLVVGQSLL
jgi:hypothetical protein